MAIIKPFKGIRPNVHLANLVASKPYDVLNPQEAAEEAKGNRYSFYHVVKPEIDVPDIDSPYNEAVYKKGRENFIQFMEEGVFTEDIQESYYVYRLSTPTHSQTGIVGLASLEEYKAGLIKKHELTRPVKVDDRNQHLAITKIQAEPVFYTYKAHEGIDGIVNEVIKHLPQYSFTTNDHVTHDFWVIQYDETVLALIKYFSEVKDLYIADGHHRTEAAAHYARSIDATGASSNDAHKFIMSINIPDNQLQIINYDRLLKDLNGLSTAQFLEKLIAHFEISEQKDVYISPPAKHYFSLYIDKKWYLLLAKDYTYRNTIPTENLDVSVFTNYILKETLAIEDPQTDIRIDFAGGIAGSTYLQKKVDSGEMKAAFVLYPLDVSDFFTISDFGLLMPPKSTWFEPKPRSGLVIYSLE